MLKVSVILGVLVTALFSCVGGTALAQTKCKAEREELAKATGVMFSVPPATVGKRKLAVCVVSYAGETPSQICQYVPDDGGVCTALGDFPGESNWRRVDYECASGKVLKVQDT